MHRLGWNDLKSWKKLSCLIALIGMLLFSIITIITMIFIYDGYSFTEDYISYLGTTNNVRTGSNNEISKTLFIIACVIAGASLIPFWIVSTKLFVDNKIAKLISYFSSLLGLLSCPCLMGIGIFPGDTQYSLHAYSARGFFILFPAAIFFYSFAILFQKDYPNIYSLVGFAFFVFIAPFLLGLLIQFNPIAQKIIVYGFFVWVALQITNIWKNIESENRVQ